MTEDDIFGLGGDEKPKKKARAEKKAKKAKEKAPEPARAFRVCMHHKNTAVAGSRTGYRIPENMPREIPWSLMAPLEGAIKKLFGGKDLEFLHDVTHEGLDVHKLAKLFSGSKRPILDEQKAIGIVEEYVKEHS